jgi:hypothetical protein
MSTVIDIVAEPIGTVYKELLDLAAELCGSFSLVWRDQLKFSRSADGIKDALSPFLLRDERTDEWPGTKLMGHFAQVRHYRVDARAMRLLENAPGLYAWLAPDYPEDLVFYAADGTVWMGSIAHEKDAWFVGWPGVEANLRRRIPSLELAARLVSDQ